MEQRKSNSPKLFVCTAIENKDDVEERYERAYNYFQSLVADCSEKEAHDALNNAVCKNHEEVSVGMLMSILTEPHNATKCYRDLTLVTRDGLTCVLNNLSTLILDRYLKFQDTTRNQLIWLLKEMIRNVVTGVDSVCWNLMRYASGGDITPKNIILVESLLDIYIENRAWLDKSPVLICMVVYTYLRLIEDHNLPHLANLRQKEVNFVIALIRERFSEVINLGRDLVRLLQNVACIPEFNQLWQDILLNPKSLCPTFTNVLQLLQSRTSRRYLQSRLTPDMERKLVFLTSQVRFGSHKKYQEWFQRQYLATPESQSLRSDMIRFIVGVIHPTNELLCSDIIPRWAVIGWLLTTCTSNVAASNAKLALFYDWLFYDPEKDNIMNIEPAILVMHHSMRSHPAVTATLLDFLCRIIPNFYPQYADKVKQGIYNSLQQIIEKRVLPNLQPLFDSPKLDRELRTTVRETFKEFCTNGNGEGVSGIREEGNEEIPRGGPDEPAFSDDEDESPPAIVEAAVIAEDTDDDDLPLSEVRARERPELADAMPLLLRPFAETLLDERSSSATTALLNACSAPMPTPTALADLVTAAVQDSPPLHINSSPKPAELDAALNSPIFSMFPFLTASGDGAEARRKLVLETFKEIHKQDIYHNVGFYLLFYLKVCYERELRAERDVTKRRQMKFKAELYREYCSFLELKIGESLADDFERCQECDANVLVWLIPDVYREFKDQAQNHIRLLHTIVSTLDASQLQQLVCLTLQGNLMMFKSDDITTMLSTSLGWETFEQYCLWQLLTAHDISVEDVLPIIPNLSYKDHSEALTSVLLMLKQEKPNTDVLRQLFCRPVDQEDTFVVSTLMYWCQDYEDKVGDLISVLLSTRYPGTSPNKRKRPGKHSIPPNAPPSAELVLGHLEQLRLCCLEQDDMSLFNMQCMQKALQQAQSNSSDSLRRQYGDLFCLVWEDELPISRRARKMVSMSMPINQNLHSSNDDSEEEEIVKPKQAKRRKKAISDSD
ncbi:integrator complex subunit 3 homolog [Amyelois transitella]|uniref:integrator complex subunit 3 homolog n=1 Tax=Amyelois transitella TaxID=680683 RepID=UPI00067C3EE9|nr:integrator complex subunit 3 homolog [Amyelois transitella]